MGNTNISKTINFEFDVYSKLIPLTSDTRGISKVVNDLLKQQFSVIESTKKVQK